jgi:hypothetical protein
MMRLIALASVLALVTINAALCWGVPAQDARETIINFDNEPAGSLPYGWKAEGTNQQGPIASWQVIADSSAPSKSNVLALAKTNHDSGSTFNICWSDGQRFKDGRIQVKLKAVSGAEDQGGGIIWRVKDKDNYYIARYNPLEDNFRVYFVKEGSRKQLASEKVTLPSGQWITMRIEQDGEHIQCFLNEKKYLDVADKTLADEGGIGFWTKADAVTSFDDLKIVSAGTGNVKAASAEESAIDTAKVEQITGLKGAMNTQENVFKVSQPRTDVSVKVDGRTLEPFMGLTSWASFTPGKGSPAMVMGDLVLFQDEVNPVMDALFDAGLSVTALHNHFLHAEPSVYFMHIGGEGAQDDLAKGVRSALDEVKAIRAAAPQPGTGGAASDVPTTNSISADKVKAILGVEGTAKDGMFKVVIGREVKMPCGCTLGKEMGVNTWAAFAGSDDRAIVDGDFVTLDSGGEGELQPVLKALRTGGINIVAIHNHMQGESPKAIFLHYWGVGRAEVLACAVKSALDAQAVAAKPHDHH